MSKILDSGRLGRWWRERRPMMVSVVLLIVGLPPVVFMALNLKPKSSPIIDQTREQAAAATEQGDYAEAYNKLKGMENQATTKEQKLALLSDLASAAANAGKLREAIDYLLTKHQLAPETVGQDADMLAALYLDTGNTAKALESYREALEYYKSLPEDENNNAQIQSLEIVIKDLEAGSE